jgi:WD40 repeat protein
MIMHSKTPYYRHFLTQLTGILTPVLLLCFISTPNGKVREFGRKLHIRPVTIRNLDYASDGHLFAIPNFVSAGSVALFWVDEQGTIASVPSRLSEKNFTRSRGMFFLKRDNEKIPHMAFISLPELLTGYSVDFTESGRQLAIAGGKEVVIYSGDSTLEKSRSLTVGSNVTRAVFSPDGALLAVISDGKCYLFSTATYALTATLEPARECRFSDVTFSHDSKKCALFEFRSLTFDFGSRIRIYFTEKGMHDRDLPFLPARPVNEPGVHLPLVSYSPDDTALAVTVHSSFTGKVYLIKSNDGTILREFKGFCHAFSPDGTLFIAEGAVYSTNNWTKVGKIPRSTKTCIFSPTERVIIAVTQDAVRRFRIEK